MRKALLVIGVVSITSTVMAEGVVVYKWIDENNVVHFSQHQPQHVNFEQVTVFGAAQKPTATKSALASAVSPANVTDSNQSPQNELNESSIKNQDIERCEAATKNIETLKTFENIQFTAEDGSVRVLTEKEKEQQLRINQTHVEVYCQQQ